MLHPVLTVLALRPARAAHVPHARSRGNPFAGFRFRDYPRRFWRWSPGALFTLMRFSEAFLVLRASDAGCRGLGAADAGGDEPDLHAHRLPAGWLSDRMSRPLLLRSAALVMVGADLLMAFGRACRRVRRHRAVGRAHGPDRRPVLRAHRRRRAATLRGTAFGVVNLARG
jgi:hypothetical protein